MSNTATNTETEGKQRNAAIQAKIGKDLNGWFTKSVSQLFAAGKRAKRVKLDAEDLAYNNQLLRHHWNELVESLNGVVIPLAWMFRYGIPV